MQTFSMSPFVSESTALK